MQFLPVFTPKSVFNFSVKMAFYPNFLKKRTGKVKGFLVLEEHKAAGNEVVESLAFLGQPDSEEAEEDNKG